MAQKYPDEIKAIIGIDMAMPEAYDSVNANPVPFYFLGIGSTMGIKRISCFFPINTSGLNQEEQEQVKYLTYRNAANKTLINELKSLRENAAKVQETAYPKMPMLLFSSDGSEIGDFWIECQKNFAKTVNAKLIQLNCGHYIHQYEPEKLADECKLFLKELEQR
jgi:hypothetical protein